MLAGRRSCPGVCRGSIAGCGQDFQLHWLDEPVRLDCMQGVGDFLFECGAPVAEQSTKRKRGRVEISDRLLGRPGAVEFID